MTIRLHARFASPRATKLRLAAGAMTAFLVALAVQAAPTPLSVEEVRSRVAAVDARKYDSDVVAVIDHTDVLVRDNGIGETTTRRVVKVLRDGGIRSQTTQRFDYDPTTNRQAVRAVRIYRADGTTEELPLSDLPDQPQPQWGIYWSSRQTLVSVPRLEVGDAVETIVEKVGFNVAYLADGGTGDKGAVAGDELTPPMPGHWYDEVSFWSGVPIIDKRYTVRAPRDKPIQFAVYNGELRSSVGFDGQHVVYTFEKSDIPVWRGEANMVSASDVACKLVLATVPDWESKSRWYHAANEAGLAADDAIRTKTAEITAPCKTDEDKIVALSHWVAENIRYVGTSRGSCEGYTSHAATETFRDRGGVCKDKAAMLASMLRVAGFDAFVVMTMAGAEVYPVPADQFNHSVTCIRSKDGELRLLDPTWMPKNRDVWSHFEQLQHVVYGVPDGRPLMRSPYVPPEKNRMSWSAQSEIGEGGGLVTRVSIIADGGTEGSLRRSLAGTRPADRERLFDDWAQRLSGDARVAKLTAMDPVDFSGPMAVSLELTAAGWTLGERERRYVALPALRNVLGDHLIGDVLGAAGPESHKFPIKVRTTRIARIEETIRVPAAWKIESAPEPVKIDTPVAALVFEPTLSAGQLHYVCELTIRKHRIEPAEYGDFKRVIDAFGKLAADPMICTMEAPSARL